MREKDKDVFYKAAQHFTCWIGLPFYTPKAQECKAKTADNATHRFGGLVVDPTIGFIGEEQPFTPNSRGRAIESWNQDFLIGGRLPMDFTVVGDGTDKGLVKHNGSYIHADFDIMQIHNSNLQGQHLPTTNHEQNLLFRRLMPMLNQGFGAKMIQHSAEFMWKKGVGAKEREWVLWFGPGRRFNQWESSMPGPHKEGGGH